MASVSGRSARSVQKPDRRVVRTRRLLHGALIDLVRERGWDAVTVQDVCARADVGRSTFYVHFADKEELLVHGFAELRQALLARGIAADGRPLGFTRALLEHAREYQPIYRALLGRRTAQVVYRAFLDVVIACADEDVGAFAERGALRDAAVRYVAGGLWELLGLWAAAPASGARAVDVEGLFRRLTLPVLRELRERP